MDRDALKIHMKVAEMIEVSLWEDITVLFILMEERSKIKAMQSNNIGEWTVSCKIYQAKHSRSSEHSRLDFH